MSVQYIRTLSAENIIADVVQVDTDTLTLRNPIVAMLAAQEGQLGFAPWAPLQDPALDEVTVPRSTIVFITEPAPEIIEQYGRMYSNIVTPTKKLIV